MDELDILIQLTDINFSYNGGRPVLNGLDFRFIDGCRAGLVGANGSGKTTLFHIIMGLLKPDSGNIEIFGKEIVKEKDFRDVRAGIGFVFQDADDQLFCPTVAEDVAFGPLNLGLSHQETGEVVRETLSILGLEGFENRITYKLSGGEKKLVSLATVLAMKPRMLMLDEPTTGLDENTVDRLVQVLNDINLPYLIISHDKDFLDRTTSRTFKMESGRVIDV